MFCAECGAKIEDGAKFCANCGSPVDFTSQDMGWGQPDETSTQGHPSRKPFPVIAVIGVAAGVVLLFAVVFVLLRKPSGDEPAFAGVGDDDESEEEEKTKKTKGTKEADAEWKEEYLDGLNRTVEESKGEFTWAIFDDIEYYCVVDIDGNGFPEIFIKAADSDELLMVFGHYDMGECSFSYDGFSYEDESDFMYGEGHFFAIRSFFDYPNCWTFDSLGNPMSLYGQGQDKEVEALKDSMTLNELELKKGDFDDITDAVRSFDGDPSEFLAYVSLFKEIGEEWKDAYLDRLDGSIVEEYIVMDTNDDGLPEIFIGDADNDIIEVYYIVYEEDEGDKYYDCHSIDVTYDDAKSSSWINGVNFNNVDFDHFESGDIYDLVDIIRNYDYNPGDAASETVSDVLNVYQDCVDDDKESIIGVDGFGKDVPYLITDSGIYSHLAAGLVEEFSFYKFYTGRNCLGINVIKKSEDNNTILLELLIPDYSYYIELNSETFNETCVLFIDYDAEDGSIRSCYYYPEGHGSYYTDLSEDEIRMHELDITERNPIYVGDESSFFDTVEEAYQDYMDNRY